MGKYFVLDGMFWVLIYILTLGQGEPAPPPQCLHLLEQGLLELIINRGNVKFGLKYSDLLRGWDAYNV
jgi:hypothetical protein